MRIIGYILILFIIIQLFIPVDAGNNSTQLYKIKIDKLKQENTIIKENIKVLKKVKDKNIISKIQKSENIDTLKSTIIENIKTRDQIIISQDSLINNLEIIASTQDTLILEQQKYHKKQINQYKIGIVIIILVTTLILL